MFVLLLLLHCRGGSSLSSSFYMACLGMGAPDNRFLRQVEEAQYKGKKD